MHPYVLSRYPSSLVPSGWMALPMHFLNLNDEVMLTERISEKANVPKEVILSQWPLLAHENVN
jgi:hypothetical protein